MMAVNQAVIFTKPVHHLELDLTPEKLDELARAFFEQHGFSFVLSREVSGKELAERAVIKQHYLIYSTAACAEQFNISDEAKARFESAFSKTWEDELNSGKILSTAALLEEKRISVHQLFNRWNGLFGAGKAAKLQDGFIMGYLEDLEAYCVNAFYPSMEANFNNPATRINYYVVEFDSEQVSWKQFRKKVLGATNASNAVPESFRGQLYSEYPVPFPGRDNFVHGSAGPFEGFVERAIHETDFEISSNPVGVFLEGKGVTLESFAAWKAAQSITTLGDVFDATEEKNTADVFQTLEKINW
ncbi:hypothetical protein P4B35_00660 [Pontiellaceae bacterium B12227]|nr:hypothetical protein [Pontiellaceae bacterium B12227]